MSQTTEELGRHAAELRRALSEGRYGDAESVVQAFASVARQLAAGPEAVGLEAELAATLLGPLESARQLALAKRAHGEMELEALTRVARYLKLSKPAGEWSLSG
jgi:hypothetical protein